ncbi:EAL domain-containing protein [Jannaschia sp.]|nr:EAL domain-containing protein [Jannaschia sp.]
MTRPPLPETEATDTPLDYALAKGEVWRDTSDDRSTLDMVRNALERSDILLAFQPVIRVIDTRPAFHEGLVRLLDDRGRIIPAAQFMPVVESLELGRELDVAALRCGLGALSRTPDLRLSINMSARSIGYSRWVQVLHDWLARDETVGERLILEITESSAMLVPELVRVFMSELQDKGITFALDDFGAGQTCFRYLRDFYFDILKVDGSFVRGCDTNPDNQCILNALVMIGQQFDMFTVAEAVENAAEARFLARAGFDCLQGFHYGAPQVRPNWFDRDLTDGRSGKVGRTG